MAEAVDLQEQEVPYQETRLYRIRHSLAHIMAQAVRDIYPKVKFAIGPPVENGFYYDFDLGVDDDGNPMRFSDDDLEQIEKRMQEIIKGKFDFELREVTPDEARELFKDQPYKLELIERFLTPDEFGMYLDPNGNEIDHPPQLTTYRQDSFEDLCRGPHVANTKEIKTNAFKLLSVAGAYWRGDENNPQLQRIYGTGWEDKKQLKDYLTQLEEARKRDHRKLGKELDIFTFDEEVGPGLPLWLPNGAIMIEELEGLAKEMEENAGYHRVRTPHLSKEDLFLRSGHLPYYEESMYPPMELEGVRYFVKPMNCPMHHKIFGSRPRSYRELPIRLAEYGTCYRYEKSGELFGLMRVRSLQMNDAHIYCSIEQFEQEFINVVNMYLAYFRILDIEKYVMRLSTHHPRGLGKKYINNPELWQQTEDLVRNVMRDNDVHFVEVADEAAFYGPKIDVQVYSAIGREFTLATNQVDFAQPGRFDLTFVNSEGEEETPLCIHRAPLSTHERLIGFLIEHYAGKFPVWLSPVQAVVIPITDEHYDYCRQITADLRAAGIRAEFDDSSDRMNKKIRNAQKRYIPYMLVVGDREMEEGAVALRMRSGDDKGALPLAEFIAMAQEVIREKRYE
ncbi:MAG: threonine--tRNA ligase [Chloroflexi bacterium]|nr:threonine--tRNA ligase [Chloroflexota bacterium]